MTAAASARDQASMADGTLVECHECGLFQLVPSLAGGTSALCGRCGAGLRRCSGDPIGRPLAFALAGLALLPIADLMPFMSLSISGQVQDTTLMSGVVELWRMGMPELAVLVSLTTAVVPLLKLVTTAYVMIALKLPRPPRHLPSVFGWIARLEPWAMIEVYLLGVIVAYVKLQDMATLVIGPALYAVIGVMLAMIAASASFDAEGVWEVMARLGLAPGQLRPKGDRLISCHACGLVVDDQSDGGAAGGAGGHGRCQRCHCALHRRKTDSVTRSWALVLSAAILYIPANVYPVMTVISMGSGESDTILSGVVSLVDAGMWPLALLVFFASITVPLLKLIGMVILLVSTQMRAKGRLRERTRLFRIVEFIGRWSMIDIFMISILVALVRLGALATIEPGVGAICFASVVVLTMLGAMTFDPRLMWDAAGRNGRHATQEAEEQMDLAHV